MFVEEDDDEYIEESEISDELFRSVDAFSTDEEEDFWESEHAASEYYAFKRQNTGDSNDQRLIG